MWQEEQKGEHKPLAIRAEDAEVPMIYHSSKADGAGRIALLNRELLIQYNCLGQMVKGRHLKRVNYNKILAKDNIDCQAVLLKVMLKGVEAVTPEIDKTVTKITELLGELDAVGGKESFDIPTELRFYVGGPREMYRVPSRSFAYLAEAPYFLEEMYDVPLGQKNYRYLAFCINRIKYFSACGCPKWIKGFRKRVRSVHRSLTPDMVVNMPSAIRYEVDRIFTRIEPPLSLEEFKGQEEALLRLGQMKKEKMLKKEVFMKNAYMSMHSKDVLGVSDESEEEHELSLKQTKLLFERQQVRLNIMRDDLQRQCERNKSHVMKEVQEGQKTLNQLHKEFEMQEMKFEHWRNEWKKRPKRLGKRLRKEHQMEKGTVQKEDLEKTNSYIAKEQPKDLGEQLWKEQQMDKTTMQNEDLQKKDSHIAMELDDNIEDESTTPKHWSEHDGEPEYADDYPYETDDSNAEDNPKSDYPDEPSSDEDW